MITHSDVLNEILLLKGKSMFTVYDVRRILEHKSGLTVNHSIVRDWVEFYYKQAGLRRDIGYHLSYSPPPQIYYVDGQNIINYDPDALDPTNIQVSDGEAKAASIPAKSRTIKVVAVPVQTEYLYALVNKKTGERVKPFKGNTVGLYKTRNGPVQLQDNRYYYKDYEVIKYEVVLKPVGV
jgi:hypothetical protein